MPTISSIIGPPAYTPLGKRLQERTEQLQPEALDAQYGYAHGHLSEAMMRGLEQLGTLIDPPDPAVPWQPLFDIDLCPDWALPWLAQCVGVRLPQSVTAAQARALIVGLGLHKRGTIGAIVAAGEPFLDEGVRHTVYVRERDGGDPYRLEIVTAEESLPESDRELINWQPNPRPLTVGGLEARFGAGPWDPMTPGFGVMNSMTLDSWNPPDAPPSRRSVKISGHVSGVDVNNANNRINVITGPFSAAHYVFNPLPMPGRYVTCRVYLYPVKGLANLSVGVKYWKADGSTILSGGYRPCPLNQAWHAVDVQSLIETAEDLGSEVTGYAVHVTATGITGQDFEFSVSSMIATERDNAHSVVEYGDPIANPQKWVWNGVADQSISHRIPTTIVRDAYASQVPGGIVFGYRKISGWDYQAMTAQGGTYAEQTADYSTYAKLAENEKD